MRKAIVLVIISLICISCKSQEPIHSIVSSKEFLKKQNRFHEKFMGDQNILIMNLLDVDSVHCKRYSSITKNYGINFKKDSKIVIIPSYKPKDFNEQDEGSIHNLIIFRNAKIMQIAIKLRRPGSYGNCTYIEPIIFKEGDYSLLYPSFFSSDKPMKLIDEKRFFKSISKDYFYNEKERKNFLSLEFEYVSFLKDKDKFIWKKVE